MSLNKSTYFFCLLLSSLLSCGQKATPQSTKETTKSPLIESGRISPSEFDLPMHLTPFLSGNFGELRNNHFHSGIDIKTLKGVGYPIYAVADGWVSRIRISNYGFGCALYMDHPNGFTTLYGHLQKYAPEIALFAKTTQYKNEQFELDTLLKPGFMPIKRGQLIAYSGNAGTSAAPHLHFEIRDTKSEETIDPLFWYTDRFKDSTPPRFEKIAIYAAKGEGSLSTGSERSFVVPVKTSQGIWKINGKLPSAWGKIGVGLNAYDFMNQTSNQYGVCNISLFLENEKIYQQDMSRFAFSQTRYVNALTDYEAWQKSRIWIMKSFLEPGNNLRIYPIAKNRGYININEEKTYHLRYEIKDRAGNTAEIRFEIQGQRQEIPVQTVGKFYLKSWVPNHFTTADVVMDIPAGALYKDIDFQFEQKPSTGYSDIYCLHNSWTPLQLPVSLTVRIQKDELTNKEAYYLAKQSRYGSYQYAGGEYSNGRIQARIIEFGDYTVKADTIPPKIVGLGIENAVKNRLFRIRISDTESGIKSWRGTIDGAWVLFEFDCKTSQLRYYFDENRLTRGKDHKLLLIVKDACGNESSLEKSFIY